MNTDKHIQGCQRTNNTESLLARRRNPTNRLALSEATALTGKLRLFQPGEIGIEWTWWTVLGGLVAHGSRSSGHGEKQRLKSTTTISRRRTAGTHTRTHTSSAPAYASYPLSSLPPRPVSSSQIIEKRGESSHPIPSHPSPSPACLPCHPIPPVPYKLVSSQLTTLF